MRTADCGVMDEAGTERASLVLVADRLGKRYRSKWALRDVSLQLPRGTVTALVGPNGAGKSTLLRIWVGFERATLGTATVLGEDPWRHRVQTTAHLGYIAQHPSLYGRLTAQDHLELAKDYRPEFDLAGATRRLRRLDIDPSARAGELSGGQQAQVGRVLALGTRAEILLLDEPLASLDPLARRDFLSLLVETTRELGATTVLSSHVVSDIPEVCDRLIVLADGRVKLHDTVERAIRTHYLVEEPDRATDAPGLVGSFANKGAGRSAIVRSLEGHTPLPARPATLEEVVIGYLAGDRR